MSSTPNAGAESVFHDLADCMMQNGKISGGYELKGHRQTGSTECPGWVSNSSDQQHRSNNQGDALYEEIQTWPHWTSGNIGFKANITDVEYDAQIWIDQCHLND